VREKPGQGVRRKSFDGCTGKNQGKAPFSTGRIFSRAAAVSFVGIVHHVSKSDADKDASREQIRPVKNTLLSKPITIP
jgi:hypothetical protein